MKLFEQFKPYSKSEWIDLVRRDLKSRTIEELNFKFSESIEVSPFIHREDLSELINIPAPWAPKPLLGTRIIVCNEKIDNLRLIEELEGGVNFLSIDCTNKSSVNFKILFKGVYLDLIDIQVITGTNERILEDFDQYVTDHYLKNVKIRCTVISSFEFTQSYKRYVFFETDPTISIETQLSELLIKGNNLLSGIDENVSCYFRMSFDHNYLLNICKVRAARLLWANLCEIHECTIQNQPIILEGYMDSAALSEDEYENMIALTQIGVSMVSGGIDILFLDPSDQKINEGGTKFSRRISRNIYNLMLLESQMGEVCDPTAGSYFFDKTSVELAEAAWSKFIR